MVRRLVRPEDMGYYNGLGKPEKIQPPPQSMPFLANRGPMATPQNDCTQQYPSLHTAVAPRVGGSGALSVVDECSRRLREVSIDHAIIAREQNGNVVTASSPNVSEHLDEIFTSAQRNVFEKLTAPSKLDTVAQSASTMSIPATSSSAVIMSDYTCPPRLKRKRPMITAQAVPPSSDDASSLKIHRFQPGARHGEVHAEYHDSEVSGESPRSTTNSFQERTFRIGDRDTTTEVLVTLLELMNQQAVKVIAKQVIKFVEPGKQAKHPYTVRRHSRDDSNNRNANKPQQGVKPAWWPEQLLYKGKLIDMSFREPDHLMKPSRVSILLHTLRLRVTQPEYYAELCRTENANSRKWKYWAEWLKLKCEPLDLGDKNDEEPISSEHFGTGHRIAVKKEGREHIMSEIFKILKIEEQLHEDEIDESTIVHFKVPAAFVTNFNKNFGPPPGEEITQPRRRRNTKKDCAQTTTPAGSKTRGSAPRNAVKHVPAVEASPDTVSLSSEECQPERQRPDSAHLQVSTMENAMSNPSRGIGGSPQTTSPDALPQHTSNSPVQQPERMNYAMEYTTAQGYPVYHSTTFNTPCTGLQSFQSPNFYNWPSHPVPLVGQTQQYAGPYGQPGNSPTTVYSNSSFTTSGLPYTYVSQRPMPEGPNGISENWVAASFET